MFFDNPLSNIGLDSLIGYAPVAINNIHQDISGAETTASNLLIMTGEIDIDVNAEIIDRFFEGPYDFLAACSKTARANADPHDYFFLVIFSLLQLNPLFSVS